MAAASVVDAAAVVAVAADVAVPLPFRPAGECCVCNTET